MKRLLFVGIVLLIIGVISFGVYFNPGVLASVEDRLFGEDPDMPGFLADVQEGMTKEEFMIKRSEQIAMMRGIEKDKPFDPQQRIAGIKKMESQEAARNAMPDSPTKDALAVAWTEIGPNPIPNGQVQSGVQMPVSGRTVTIAVHPTNANIVYVGTAQGGLYRTTDGGTTWTPLLDNALSLAVGAVAISPSQPDTIYVGTGEPQFSSDSFFGAGLYRIDNASTASPIVTGPLGSSSFNGRGIGEIIVHPTDPATIFVASTSGVGGILAAATSPLPNRGVYRSTDATSAAPTFTQIGVLASPNNNFSVRDIAIDPSNPNILIADLVAGGGGLYRSTNALAATPTWTQVSAFASGTAGTSNLTAEFAAIHPAADTNATFYAATGNVTGGSGSGRILKSTDGGATFTQINATGFCNPQCFYNIAIDVDPTNVNNVYIGGTGANTFDRSTNGGTTFTPSQNNLHTDSHAIAVAPSLPSTIYFGSDGGIYKSIDSGTTWTSLNNTTFRATQFQSVAVHPTDPTFTIGGSQDNGTECLGPCGTNVSGWVRADFGDGGNTVIDQNALNTTTVTMYHTYFNQTNAMGYARVLTSASATDNGWSFFGCGFGGSIPNGMTCTATAILFYAPMEQGPGNPNTLYFGSDVLYRSADSGTTVTKVSQDPITSGAAISAIGISPQNDNVRIIGQNTGGIFGTSAGAATLTDLDPTNAVPNSPIARAVIDPQNVNTAYVTLSAFNVVNVWKTTSLSSAADGGGNIAPTWTAAAGAGAFALPQVPVNAFLVDPLNSNRLYAGTDIGVYTSSDGGNFWRPFGTGLPRVAVFDMAITSARVIRIATHGRGMWDIPAMAPTAAGVSVAGRVRTSGGLGISKAIVAVTDAVGNTRRTQTNPFGYYRFEDMQAGQTYIFAVSSKRYQFAPQVSVIDSNLENFDFSALAEEASR